MFIFNNFIRKFNSSKIFSYIKPIYGKKYLVIIKTLPLVNEP